jgi:AcrR family transcriptional regulator
VAVEGSRAQAGRRRRETTRQDLLDATKRLLEGGAAVADLSVDRIVAEAGIARRTFYLHFRDKEELIAALVEDQIAWRDELGAQVLAPAELTREHLERLMADVVARWIESQAALAAMVEVAEYDREARAAWDGVVQSIAVSAAQYLRSYWARSGTEPPDVDAVARVITWMLERSCHQASREPAARESITAGLAEVVWRLLDYRPRDAAE